MGLRDTLRLAKVSNNSSHDHKELSLASKGLSLAMWMCSVFLHNKTGAGAKQPKTAASTVLKDMAN